VLLTCPDWKIDQVCGAPTTAGGRDDHRHKSHDACCNDIDMAVRHLAGLDYVLDFTALAAPGSPRKRTYLSFEADVHVLAFMRSNTGLPIELVRYPRPPSSRLLVKPG
jgi:hypothetical protein